MDNIGFVILNIVICIFFSSSYLPFFSYLPIFPLLAPPQKLLINKALVTRQHHIVAILKSK